MQNQRELSTFALAPRHRARLTSAGFLTVEDVKDLKPTELAKEVKISPDEALEILTIVQESSKSSNSSGQPPTQTVSALDLLSREDALQPIITFSEQLDAMLGGGIPLCKTTEFCGAPGVGKTQVCLQLAVDVQIPAVFGGVEGEAVYIDTEGSFIVERLVDIATATVDHCQQIASLDANPGQVEVMKRFDLQSVLSGVHYYRCHDYIQLLATVHLLPEFIQKHPKVRLVIVDSIAFHFRHGFDDLAMRTRLLTGMAQSFIKLATKHKLAVVLTNQMTTKIGGGAQGSHLIPALGESWGHASTIRVILYWEGKQRRALLYKSPSMQETAVSYQIMVGGIRDVCDQTDRPTDNSSGEDIPQAKRPRVS